MVEGYIYKLTLLKNTDNFKKGECYIGKHNGAKPYYTGSGKIVKRLLSKYGNSIFHRELLAKNLNTNDLLCYLEVYYIDYYRCNRSITGTGLNLTEGGEGIFGYTWSEERKKASSKRLKKAAKLGKLKIPSNRKPVHQYDLYTGIYIATFKSSVAAARYIGAKDSSGISLAARDLAQYANGFIWSYRKMDIIDKKYPRGNPVLQYSLEGELLKEWLSPIVVQKELGFNLGAICNCCDCRSKTSYKFIWKWKNKNTN